MVGFLPLTDCILLLCVWGRQWWDGEVERGQLLTKARVVFELNTLDPTLLPHHTPAFLQHRLAACVPLPRVEMGEIRDQPAGEQEMEGAWDGDEERAAVLGFVVGHLEAHLFREFMEAIRPW